MIQNVIRNTVIYRQESVIGLEDWEMIVNRSPVKGKLARSTPELIVEKLAEDGDGFYERLLEKFEERGSRPEAGLVTYVCQYKPGSALRSPTQLLYRSNS